MSKFVCETGFDKPGKIYRPHRHERTILITLDGLLRIQVDGVWHKLKPGDMFVVEENQRHEAVVGKDGWKWVAVFDAEASEKYENIDH